MIDRLWLLLLLVVVVVVVVVVLFLSRLRCTILHPDVEYNGFSLRPIQSVSWGFFS